MFESVDLPEWLIGLILLIISLVVLCLCLVLMVKTLTSIFKGHLKNILVRVVNADFPGFGKYLTPYIAMLVN